MPVRLAWSCHPAVCDHRLIQLAPRADTLSGRRRDTPGWAANLGAIFSPQCGDVLVGLLYGTAGAAFGNIQAAAGAFPFSSTTEAGWTADVGLEYAFWPNWTAKLEYLFVDLGTQACSPLTVARKSLLDSQPTT